MFVVADRMVRVGFNGDFNMYILLGSNVFASTVFQLVFDSKFSVQIIAAIHFDLCFFGQFRVQWGNNFLDGC